MEVLGANAKVVWKAADDRISADGVMLYDRTNNNDQFDASQKPHPGARRAWTGPTIAREAELWWSTLKPS